MLLILPVLGIPLAYWDHFAFVLESRRSDPVPPFPVAPLKPPNPKDRGEASRQCILGPISIELPASMEDISLVGDRLPYIMLSVAGGGRTATITVGPGFRSGPRRPAFAFESNQPRPRLLLQVAEADSQDFSFAMTRRELARFRWRLSQRREWTEAGHRRLEFGRDQQSERTLVLRDHGGTLEWESVDRGLQAMVRFHSDRKHDWDWMRRAAASYSLSREEGDLEAVRASEFRFEFAD